MSALLVNKNTWAIVICHVSCHYLVACSFVMVVYKLSHHCLHHSSPVFSTPSVS